MKFVFHALDTPLDNMVMFKPHEQENYLCLPLCVLPKLMIVDDRYALFGSANINDRSLNGEGDSEIALLVADQKNSTADLCSDGVQRPVRDFARKLRMDIWRKLFGIGLKPSAVGGVKPADHLLPEIDKPACPRSWRAVQKQAEENAAAYEAVFDYIPWSWRYSAAGQAAVSYKTIDAALKYWISKSYIKININRHTDSGFSKESCVLVTKAVNGGNTHLAIRFAYLSYLEQLLGDYKQTKNTKVQAQRRDKE
ncbi:hypothetical protein [Herbaspirillum huttiense]|uniref:PLD phosphodiesterase domain-containing protein n=2 Tax=Herbaspirillum huttiense TaxID=863372 RepID=A0AAJ2HCS0_9BURK|nr:hypothetical protein [Herbaspirillum huttiense]MDR9839663.1 hypothetical protein [Herbaspirillum huttiense]